MRITRKFSFSCHVTLKIISFLFQIEEQSSPRSSVVDMSKGIMKEGYKYPML